MHGIKPLRKRRPGRQRSEDQAFILAAMGKWHGPSTWNLHKPPIQNYRPYATKPANHKQQEIASAQTKGPYFEPWMTLPRFPHQLSTGPPGLPSSHTMAWGPRAPDEQSAERKQGRLGAQRGFDDPFGDNAQSPLLVCSLQAGSLP